MYKIGTLILFCLIIIRNYIYFKYVVVGSIRDTATNVNTYLGHDMKC